MGVEVLFHNSASVSTQRQVRTRLFTAGREGELWNLTRPPLISRRDRIAYCVVTAAHLHHGRRCCFQSDKDESAGSIHGLL